MKLVALIFSSLFLQSSTRTNGPVAEVSTDGPTIQISTGGPFPSPDPPITIPPQPQQNCGWSETSRYLIAYVLAISTDASAKEFNFITSEVLDRTKGCNFGQDYSRFNLFEPSRNYTDWCSTEQCWDERTGNVPIDGSRIDMHNSSQVPILTRLIEQAVHQLSVTEPQTEQGRALILITDLLEDLGYEGGKMLQRKSNEIRKEIDENKISPVLAFITISKPPDVLLEEELIKPIKFGVRIDNLTSCSTYSTYYQQLADSKSISPCGAPVVDSSGSGWIALPITLGVVGLCVLFCIACMISSYCHKKLHWRWRTTLVRMKNERGEDGENPMEMEEIERRLRRPRPEFPRIRVGNRTADAEMECKEEEEPSQRYQDFPGTHDPEQKDEWELPRARLTVYYNEKLGSGAFCNVFRGFVMGVAPVSEIHHTTLATNIFQDCEVAVKMLPDYADHLAKSDFNQEINFMKKLGYHSHLMSLIASVTLDSPLCLVTEYCAKGDLLRVLRTHKAEFLQEENEQEDPNAFNSRDLLSFSWQISDGMSYLASKDCVHRDVAARNVLINAAKVAKIGDFGLCRVLDQSIYTTRGGRLPIKWMSFESLVHYEYTTKSDVWSFGVTLYEIFTLGEVPFPTVQPADIIEHLKTGNRLPKPERCPDQIYDVMSSCWMENPRARPSFETVRDQLATIVAGATEQLGYLDLNETTNFDDDE